MTSKQIESYLENKDASYITLQMFNERQEDKYPAFTFCFKSDYGSTYSRKVNELHINRSQYSFLLKGGSESTDILDNYFQRSLQNDHNLFSLKIEEVLTKFDFTTKNGKHFTAYSNHTFIPSKLIDAALFLSYQDPDHVCYTRKTEGQEMIGSIRETDTVYLNVNSFFEHDVNANLYINGSIQIFLHHPLQFIRSMDKPVFEQGFRNEELNENKKLKFS